MFTIISMALGQTLLFSTFFLTETFFPIVRDTITVDTILEIMKISVVFTIMTGALGLISLRVGFIKKSILSIMATSVLLATVISNATGRLAGNMFVYSVITVVVVLVGAMVTILFGIKVNKIDIE